MAAPHLSPKFDTASLARLCARTEYELWLIEEAYEFIEEKLFPQYPDTIFFAPGESTPRVTYALGACNIVLGDWRPTFKVKAAPLIFVSLFKLLDMLVEWVLDENGIKVEYRFSQKIRDLELSPKYPPEIETRFWLKERIEGLYTSLDPLRGTVIHREQFSLTDGTLHIFTNRPTAPLATISIDQEQLRAFAFALVMVLKEVTGAWKPSTYRDKFLRHLFDSLAPMHLQPLLGQKRPHNAGVRVYAEHPDPHSSLAPSTILKYLNDRYPADDCMFDLRVVTIRDGLATDAFTFQWDQLVLAKLSWSGIPDIDKHRVPIPHDIDAKHLNPKAS